MDIRESMTSFLKEKSSRSLAYARYGVKSEKIYSKCRSIFAQLSRAKEVVGCDFPTVVAVFILLVALLDDDEEALFRLADEYATKQDVDLRSCPNSSFLIFCGDSKLVSRRAMLVVDGCVVMDNITSFLSAVTVLFASFYCLNIHYPEGANGTLEFIQRVVGISPSNGSKYRTKSNRPARSSRVLSLVSALGDYETVD